MIKLHKKSMKQNFHHRHIFSYLFDAIIRSHCHLWLVMTTNGTTLTAKIQCTHTRTGLYLHVQLYEGGTKALPSILIKRRTRIVDSKCNAYMAIQCDSYEQQQQMQYYVRTTTAVQSDSPARLPGNGMRCEVWQAPAPRVRHPLAPEDVPTAPT